MSQFHFRLATLLKLREAERDTCRESLAQAFQAEAVLKEQQIELEQQVVDLKNASSKLSHSGIVPVDRLIDNQRYEMVLKAEQQLAKNRLEQINAEVERRRLLLVEADRHVRLLERLRERQQQRHDESARRKENKQMDEIAERSQLEQIDQ